MKKVLIVLLSIVMLFTLACAPETEPPFFPELTPSGSITPGPSNPSGSNPSGTTPSYPSGSPSGTTPSDPSGTPSGTIPSDPSGTPSGTVPSDPSGTIPSDPSGTISLPSGTLPGTPSVGTANDKYVVTISLKDNGGKMTGKDIVKTNIAPITTDLPSNASSFPYISNFTPKDMYELPFAYNKGSGTSLNSLLGIVAETNALSIEERVLNFVRYIYCLSEGKLLLSVSYDTSAIYQTNTTPGYPLVNGGISIRMFISAKQCSLDATTFPTFYSFLYSTYDGLTEGQSLVEYFSKDFVGTANPFIVTPITQNDLAQGAGFWADVFIGMPLTDGVNGSALWNHLCTGGGWNNY